MIKWIAEETFNQAVLGAPKHAEKCEAEGFVCEGPYSVIIEVPSHTIYPWNGVGKNPNRNRFLCPECAEEHEQYWAQMWGDYYSGRL